MSGASYETIKGNVLNLIKKRNAQGRKSPTIVVCLALSSINKDELKAEYEFWKPLADEVYFGFIVAYGNVDKKLVYRGEELPTGKKELTVCKDVFRALSILSNGDVTFCCRDLNADVLIGNVKDSSIERIWNSQRANEIRRHALKKNYAKVHPICFDCIDVDKALTDKVDLLKKEYLQG